MAAQGKHHIDVSANALHQAANFGQVAGAVERTVARTNDVDAGFFTLFANTFGHFFHAVLGPQPVHGAVGTLPLVFIDGARQKAHQVGALGGHATTNHFGDRASDDHSWQVGV